MAVFVVPGTKNYILTALKDTTDGIIRISIYDDGNSFIGSEQTIAWGVPTDGVMDMSSADIVFNVPANTVVSGITYWFEAAGALSTAVIYSLEAQKTYNNPGTFTVTGTTMTVV